MSDSPAVLSEIWIYPVKSLGGIKLTAAQVEERGLEYDRRWLIVDENGVFITQREYPGMALISVAIEANGLLLYQKHLPESKVNVPFEPTSAQEIDIKIWKDQLSALTVSDEADSWLTNYFGRQVHLVKLPESAERLSPAEPGSHRSQVSFADDFPFLLISEGSLQDLNSRLDEPVTMDRFRPNFVVSGTAPFAEDEWTEISISGLRFELVSPCERCIVVTINQQTAERKPDPLKTLARYRRKDKKILFGQNLIGLDLGTIRVGDTVEFTIADQSDFP